MRKGKQATRGPQGGGVGVVVLMEDGKLLTA